MTVSRHYVNVFDRCKRVATSQGPFVRLKLRCTREFFAHGAMNKYTYYYTGRQPLCFAADVKIFFSSPPILRGPSIDPHQTSPHVRRDPFFFKFRQKNFGLLLQKRAKRAKFRQFGVVIANTSGIELDHQTENGVANCDLSSSCVLNLVNFSQQTTKSRTSYRLNQWTQWTATRLGFATLSSYYLVTTIRL